MSPPVGPRPPPSLRTPPLTHAASAAQVATSRATPEIPPPLGGGGHVGRGEPRGPSGEGHREYWSHARGPLGIVVRDFSEVGVCFWGVSWY